MWKPKSANQKYFIANDSHSASDCMDEYHNFRDCIIREKKMFRSLIGDVDVKKNP